MTRRKNPYKSKFWIKAWERHLDRLGGDAPYSFREWVDSRKDARNKRRRYNTQTRRRR